jgi:phage FluMu gp28-like protein
LGLQATKELECEFWHRIAWESTQLSIQWVLEDLTPEIRLLEGDVYHSFPQVTNIQKGFGVIPAPGSK